MHLKRHFGGRQPVLTQVAVFLEQTLKVCGPKVGSSWLHNDLRLF